MAIEQEVAAHYGRDDLVQTVLSALTASGADVDHLTTADLAGADEFHLGGRAATVWFATALAFPPDARVLDLGSGLGGPARHFVEEHQLRVVGVDLTESYVEVATELSQRVGLAERATFSQGSVLDLPFADGSFDGAYTVHVAMNIADKQRLFAEARRVLRQGGRFGILDLMRTSEDELSYPMPWADTAATSFVETPWSYRTWLTAARFAVEREERLSDLVLQLRREAKAVAPAQLGLQTLLGPELPERIGTAMSAVKDGTIAPVGMVATAV